MVPPHDPEELIPGADEARENANQHAKDVLRYFLDNQGLFERSEAIDIIEDELDVERAEADRALSSLVGDIVDPVQQVPHPDGRYVGVIEYQVFEDEGAYGYVHYSDRFGQRKRAVCARCVETKVLDENVTHATQGEGSASPDASWQDLLNLLTAHYADAHDVGPESIEPGASLISSTTMGGNQAWHDGNVTGGTNISITNQTVDVLGATRRVTSTDGAAVSSIVMSPSATNHNVTVAGSYPPTYPDAATGSLWHTAVWGDSIYKLDQTGSIVTGLPHPGNQPQGIDIDERDGSLWHTDESGVIYKLDQTGSVVTQFDSPSGIPQGIDIDEGDGSLWHVDENAQSIYKLDQTGSVVTGFASPSGNPAGIEIDERDGSLWHADEQGSIYKLDQTGSVVTQFASSGGSPLFLAIDEGDGSLWHVDEIDESIYKLDQSGSIVTGFATPSGSPAGIDIVDHDNSWVEAQALLELYDELITGWAGGSEWSTDYGSSASGSLWHADVDFDSIYKLDQTGSVVTQFASPSGGPEGIDIDERDGSLWHSDWDSGSIYKLDQTGSVVTGFAAPGGNPRGIDIDERDGSLWHADYIATSIYKLDQTGSVVTQFASPSAEPRGIDIDERDGSLWHADATANSIYKLDGTGSVVTQFASPSGDPIGIDIDERDDSLWNADIDAASIFKLDQTGSVVTGFASPGSYPTGIDITDHVTGETIHSIIKSVVGTGELDFTTPSNVDYVDIEGQYSPDQFTVEWRE